MSIAKLVSDFWRKATEPFRDRLMPPDFYAMPSEARPDPVVLRLRQGDVLVVEVRLSSHVPAETLKAYLQSVRAAWERAAPDNKVAIVPLAKGDAIHLTVLTTQPAAGA